MTDITQNLLSLFSKLMMHPEFMMALHQSYHHEKSDMHRRGPGRVLRLIAQHDGLTNSEIAEILDIRPSSVTALVNKLVEYGWVEKTTLEDDRRVTILKLTDKGKTAITQTKNAHNQFSEDIFAGLSTQQQQQLVEMLHTILSNLKTIGLDDEHYAALHNHCWGRHQFGPRRPPFCKD